ncbi:MAG: phosphopantetheine-binding protein [Lentisphaeraceae bacterium]|nr:phosphopantetheine-binding protein [Lentisphaeraceae bacterium]
MQDNIKQIMSVVLEVPLSEIDENSSSDSISSWDSLKHMNLIIALEQEFGVAFDEDTIPEIQSFSAISSALQELL